MVTHSKSATKNFGRIFTPHYLVEIILDFAGYSDDILRKHIIDNSCGDGAFLTVAVKRYCTRFLEESSDLEQLKTELETYIHGIEIDAEVCKECRKKLDEVALQYGISEVLWNVVCDNALTNNNFYHQMDFVVGNPPYVRVHNLEDAYKTVKQWSFSQGGMTDLFIVFFQIGFRMLSPQGKMCIITPSSWLTSGAGRTLRNHILTHRNLSGVIDLEHFQAFNATTYTLISRFDQSRNKQIDYYTFDGKLCLHEPIDYEDFNINRAFYLADKKQLKDLRKIRFPKHRPRVVVKNGFATLADKVFIGDFDFQEHTIDVIKASTGKWQKSIFPYDEKGQPLSEEALAGSEAYRYLCLQKEKLAKGRDLEQGSPWYLFGRTQALA